MGMQSLLLRDYKKALGRDMRDILERPFNESEIPIIQKVVAKHNDSRIINFSKTVNGDELRYLLQRFIDISNSKGLKQKVCIVDHLHIYPTKKEIDEVLFICCPPAPDERKTSIFISAGFISISTSSTTGSTATVAVEV